MAQCTTKLHFPQRKSFCREAQVIPHRGTRQVRLHRSQEGRDLTPGAHRKAVRFTEVHWSRDSLSLTRIDSLNAFPDVLSLKYFFGL